MNSRRRFLHDSLLLGSAFVLPVQAHSYAKNVTILREPYQTISTLYDDLFPPSETVPGAQELNTIGYLMGVIHDERVPQARKEFLFRATKWLDEASVEHAGIRYRLLNAKQRQRVLKKISQIRWGDSYLYFLMSYFFESMFCDPVYSANLDEKGWKWLNYQPGLPRPARPYL